MLDFSFKELDELNEKINKTEDIERKNELIDILIRKINFLNYEVKKFKTDINNEYLLMDNLYAEDFGRGFAWLDTGTNDSLIQAGQFMQTIELRQGLKVACLEEIACRNGWIDSDELIKIGLSMHKGDYSSYVIRIGEEIQKAND